MKASFRSSIIFSSVIWILGIILSLRYGVAPGADSEIVLQLRLPRVILATAVGIGLSVAGALLQAVFSNPLCEPYTLGISSGSALGAVLGAALGLSWNPAGLTASALLGAALFMFVLDFASRRTGRSGSSVLLMGVMLGFLGSSLVALVMALSDANGIQGALFWLLGDLSRVRLHASIAVLLALLSLSCFAFARRGVLDALLLGEEVAASMGVDMFQTRRKLIFLSSLMVAFCVSSAGMIGFVGLIVPHYARRSVGALHRRMLPVAALLGASSLVWADLVSRLLFQGFEIPVGVITAIIGAPLFVLLLRVAPIRGSAS